MEQVFDGSSARVILVGEAVSASSEGCREFTKEGVADGDNDGSADTSTDGSVEVEIDGFVEGWDEGAVVGSIEGDEEGSTSSLFPRKWRYKTSIRSICPGVN